MDQPGHRSLISQLAEDLGWLEDHCRRQPDQAEQAGQLRLAAALVRNCLGPFLDGQPPIPLHVAVVGGAGAGKSTVANLLTGTPSAEANPQAGFTRHPIAYTGSNGPLTWSGHLGFLGPLQRLPQPSPANLDADVYQVRRVPVQTDGPTLLQNFVVWDCPDMTTWAATGYVPRLLEVAGLADVIVYVASDERYNDEVPTQFLHLLLQAGKPVVVCLMKMREADAPALVAHFQNEVLSKLPGAVVSCLAIPFLPAEELVDPKLYRAATGFPCSTRSPCWAIPPRPLASGVCAGALNYLLADQDQLLNVARHDLAALESWQGVVQAGQVEFEDRYRREYLSNEKFRRFDEALVRLLDLLEFPGAGRLVSKTLWVLRTPYRLLRGWSRKRFCARTPPACRNNRSWNEPWPAGSTCCARKPPAGPTRIRLWPHIEKGLRDRPAGPDPGPLPARLPQLSAGASR